MIQLDVGSDDDEDTTTFEKISVAIGQIMWTCVVPPPHLGGMIHIGPKSVMDITLFGAHKPPALRLPVSMDPFLNISREANDSRY